MIRHVVLMKFEHREEAKLAAEYLKSLDGCSDRLKRIEVALDFLRASNSYDLYLEMIFKDRESQLEFQEFPKHIEVRKLLSNLKKESVKVDCLMEEVADERFCS